MRQHHVPFILMASLFVVALFSVSLNAEEANRDTQHVKPASTHTTTYRFRNVLFVNSGDLKKPWQMEEGKSDQDIIALFALKEDKVEKALVGLSKMDDIYTTPNRISEVAEDMKIAMKKIDKDNTLTISKTKITLKNGDIDAVELNFSKKVDGKNVTIYMFCIPNGDDGYDAYAFQVSLADESFKPTVSELLKSLELKPRQKQE